MDQNNNSIQLVAQSVKTQGLKDRIGKLSYTKRKKLLSDYVWYYMEMHQVFDDNLYSLIYDQAIRYFSKFEPTSDTEISSSDEEFSHVQALI